MLTQHVAKFYGRQENGQLMLTRAAEAYAYPAGHRFSGDGARQQSFHFVTLLRAAVRLHSAPSRAAFRGMGAEQALLLQRRSPWDSVVAPPPRALSAAPRRRESCREHRDMSAAASRCS